MAANMIQNEEIERALQRLRDVIKNTAENNRLCIAYSGGLDSRFLAFFASKCGLKVELLHASAAHVSPSESQNAVDRALAMGLTVRVVHPPLPSPEATVATSVNGRSFRFCKSKRRHLCATAATPAMHWFSVPEAEQ